MDTSSAHRRSTRDRDDLAGEHALTDAGQLVLAILFAAAWVADSFWLEYTTFLNAYVPQWIRLPPGFALIIVSAYLARTGLSIVFGEEREEPCVIRNSVFGVVRHPVYLSEMLLYAGLLLISMSLAAGAVLLAAIVFLHRVSRHEERLLLSRFGEEYERYMRDVPMWLPRLRRRT